MHERNPFLVGPCPKRAAAAETMGHVPRGGSTSQRSSTPHYEAVGATDQCQIDCQGLCPTTVTASSGSERFSRPLCAAMPNRSNEVGSVLFQWGDCGCPRTVSVMLSKEVLASSIYVHCRGRPRRRPAIRIRTGRKDRLRVRSNPSWLVPVIITDAVCGGRPRGRPAQEARIEGLHARYRPYSRFR